MADIPQSGRTETQHGEAIARAARAFTGALLDQGILQKLAKEQPQIFEAYRQLDAAVAGWEYRNAPVPPTPRKLSSRP